MKTSDLAAVLQEWIRMHESQHPPKVKLASTGVRAMHFSAVRFICERSNISGHTLWSILDVVNLITVLSIADDTLLAVDEYDRLGTDVPIYANPNWPKKRVIRELNRRGCDTTDTFWLWEDSVPAYDVSDGG